MNSETTIEPSCSNSYTLSQSSQIKPFDKVCANKKCSVVMSDVSIAQQILWKSCKDWYCGICTLNCLDGSDTCLNC